MTAAQRVFVTGATGLLGSHVVDQIGRAGGQVVALVRAGSPNVEWLRQLTHVQVVEGDLMQPGSYQAALEGCTGVIHCAGIVGEAYRDETFHQVNVFALNSFLTCVQQVSSIKRTVYVSTLGVYPLIDHFGTDEQTPPAARGFDAYTNSKIEGEQVVKRHVEEHAMSIVTVRPGFLYGPRDRAVLPKLLRFMKSGFFIYVGDKAKLLDNTYVENAAHASILALTTPSVRQGLFNITDDPVVSKDVFIREIAKHTGLQSEFWTLPDKIARTMAAANAHSPGWMSPVVPPMTWERYKFLGLNLKYSIDKAKRKLGYSPICSFEEGMARSINWFRDEGLL